MRETAWLVCSLFATALLGGARPAGAGGAPQRPADSGPVRDAGRPQPGPSLAGVFLGGVPSNEASSGPIALSLAEATDRGLRQNLGVLIQEASVTSARGNRWKTLNDLLPRVSARVGETRQQVNLEAFGFTGFPGFPRLPSIVGPFNVFDARVFVSQSLVDMSALNSARAGAATLRAEEHALRNARELVVLVVRSLYLQAVAAESRRKAARTQTETAQALYNLATDLKTAGVVAGIDVLRAQVQLQTQRQRAIVAENDFDKQKLQLARAIGLPVGQPFTLSDEIRHEPLQAMTLDEALQRAPESRADYHAAQALVEAAEAEKKSAVGETLPSVQLNADYGDIGRKPSDAHSTFSVVAQVRIPVFEAAKNRGRVLQADAVLQQRRSELADFRARIDYEVRTAFLDVKAAEEQIQVAQTAATLADEELTQSKDRFGAGVAGNIEVVQAQETVASATENYIVALYAHNIAKASLAHAIGMAEDAAKNFLGGRR